MDKQTKSRTPFHLLDKLWPIREGLVVRVPIRRNGECVRCGRCCSLIRISVDHEFFADVTRHWETWADQEGKPIPDGATGSIKEGEFLRKHWVRISRYEGVRRGFYEQIDVNNFLYICLLLKSDLTCAAHGEYRPPVCTGYPYYGDTKKPPAGTVFIGCGFADRRFKHAPKSSKTEKPKK